MDTIRFAVIWSLTKIYDNKTAQIASVESQLESIFLLMEQHSAMKDSS